jgi:hypothetical protein
MICFLLCLTCKKERISEFVLRPVFGLPVKELGLDSNAPLLYRLRVVVYDLVVEHDHVLALVVGDYVEMLQCGHDVLFFNTCYLTQFP